jgi:uncharacterized protein YjbK
LTEVEYGRLFPLITWKEADCFSDYFFDTAAFGFRKGSSALFIRERGEAYTLTMVVDKEVNISFLALRKKNTKQSSVLSKSFTTS